MLDWTFPDICNLGDGQEILNSTEFKSVAKSVGIAWNAFAGFSRRAIASWERLFHNRLKDFFNF